MSAILLVEDNGKLAQATVGDLAEYGFNVDYVAAGQAVLDRLAYHFFEAE